MKHTERLEKLFEMAKDVPGASRQNAKIVAALYVKNKLVSVGVANNRTHTFAAKFSKTKLNNGSHTYDHNEDACSFHGETHALYQALKIYSEDELKAEKTTMYVARAKRKDDRVTWQWGSSRPCNGCARALKYFNIDRVVFMEDEGIYGRRIASEWN